MTDPLPQFDRRHSRASRRTRSTSSPSIALLACAVLLFLATGPARAGGAEPEETSGETSVERKTAVHFGRDIRPILSQRCFACHGPDQEQRQADLRLDDRDVAVEYGAIVPGDSSQSGLIERVTSEDPDLRMPPADSNKKPLTAEEVSLLKRWIDAGAPYARHWSYTQPTRPPPPPVHDASWPLNPIDRFVAAVHRREGLEPAPGADRRTLIRRLSWDLTGLPPDPAEVARFAADESPDAYEKLVEQFLESPRFGERMAVYWLDLVRFADTCGYHSDNHRDVSEYRDYVIRSFNANKPFDRFTIEQLAGDLVESPTREQRIGSAYNRLLQTTEEGGAQRKEYLAIYAADRVRNVSSVWMGTTLGCCQCHDHKFDPFTTRDFYSMAAFFADLKENVPGRQAPNLELPSPEQQERIERLERLIADFENGGLPEDLHPAGGLEQAVEHWARDARRRLTSDADPWVIVKPSAVESSGGARLDVLPDDSVLSTGDNPDRDDYAITLRSDLNRVTGLRLQALTHDSLGGRLARGNGNFVLTGVEVLLPGANDTQPRRISIRDAVADFEQPGYPVANSLDGKPDTGWAVAGHQQPADRTAVFRFQEPISLGEGAELTVRLEHRSQFPKHNIGRFRLSLTDQRDPSLSTSTEIPADVAEILRKTPEERTSDERSLLTRHAMKTATDFEAARKRLEEWKNELDSLRKSVRTMLVSEATTPRTTRILKRGNWQDDSGPVVSPATPESLFSPERDAERRATRLDLARWITSTDNPLTARVMVNRLWYLLFGNGLSRSLDDFGFQGQYPSHPELLDWLAVEFMESGWDVKHVIRLIATSRTYRQSSVASRESEDPYNLHLTRQNRFRLDAEFVRDGALAVSGLLAHDVGSDRSVKPYQPAGFWRHLNFPVRTYQADQGRDQYRRGLYTYWCRTFPHPSMTTFDAPSREECTAQRPRSNTPLQALVLLNDPTYVEAARVLAERTMEHETDEPEERVRWVFDRVLSRPPEPEEVEVMVDVLRHHRKRFAADPDSAERLLGVGQSPIPAGVSRAELASWTGVARVILNLHETITRY